MSDAPYTPSETDGQDDSQVYGIGSVPGWLIPALFGAGIVLCIVGHFIIGQVAENGMDGNHIFYPHPHGQLGDPPEYVAAVKSSMIANTAIGFAIVGAIVMSLTGLVLGLVRKKQALGVSIGLAGGAILGAIAGAVGYYLQSSLQSSSMDGLVKTFIVWLPVTIVFSLFPCVLAVLTGISRNWTNAIVTGCIGAALGTAVYVLLSGLLFTGYPNLVYPLDAGIRYLAYTALGICVGAGVTLLLFMDKPKAEATQDVTESA